MRTWLVWQGSFSQMYWEDVDVLDKLRNAILRAYRWAPNETSRRDQQQARKTWGPSPLYATKWFALALPPQYLFAEST